MRQFWHAHLDTGRDSFDAYGASQWAALAALQKALSNHARQAGLTGTWASQYGKDGIYEDGVEIRRVLMGAAYRYGTTAPLGYTPEKSKETTP